MRLIFVGSGYLGLPTLKRLAPQILLVVTAPDKPAGRGLGIISTPVKRLARQLYLPVIETNNINSPETTAIMITHQPEVIVVAAFGQMLKTKVLEIPKYCVLNIHPSLLPKGRGAAPIERAILNREEETGISIFKINERMDAGPIIFQKKITILPGEDALSLSQRLAELSAEVLPNLLERLTKGEVIFTPQDEASATYAPKITKEEGRIDWKKDALEIEAKVRAFVKWPHAYSFFPAKPSQEGGNRDEHRRFIIWKAQAVEAKEEDKIPPGTILKADEDGITVACGNGLLVIKELQVAGKKRMPIAEFLLGHKVAPGTVLI